MSDIFREPKPAAGFYRSQCDPAEQVVLEPAFHWARGDKQLLADGADSTRVVLRVTDEFGAIRPFANDAIRLELDGPADIVGDNPFVLVGGTGAVWVRAREQAGKFKLRGTHPRLGPQEVEIDIVPAPPESV